MAELKTRPTTGSVQRFLQKVKDPQQRRDCQTLVEIMQRITGAEPRMWGPSIVGFGDYHYTYESGRTGDWFVTGFSPRARNLSLYLMAGFTGREALLEKLGKHKTGRSCLYVKSLDDVHMPTLEKLIAGSVEHIARAHPSAGETARSTRKAGKKKAAGKKKVAGKKKAAGKEKAAPARKARRARRA